MLGRLRLQWAKAAHAVSAYSAQKSLYCPSPLSHFTRLVSSKGAKAKSVYVCDSCGAESPKWVGSCPACHAWDTMHAFKVQTEGSARNVSPSAFAGTVQSSTNSMPFAAKSWLPSSSSGPGRLTSLDQVSTATAARTSFHSRELDRLFGGGLVKGSVVLIAGSPGIGKSTILLQIAALLSRASKESQPYSQFFQNSGTTKFATLTTSAAAVASADPQVVAYISGEESTEQIKSRASRLGINTPNLLLMNETHIEDILLELQAAQNANVGDAPGHPTGLAAVVIDSIQTMFSDAIPSAAGTVTQVRECATRLLQFAKATSTPIFLVGHVTKSGDIAGPRVLEHLVDTVIYVESDESSFTTQAGSSSTSNSQIYPSTNLRIMRAVKHRFGATSEVGIFEMTDEGLVESDASTTFLSSNNNDSGSTTHDDDNSGIGASVAVVTEGTRSFCVEVQALATASAFPYPRHRSTGVQSDRLHMLLAVLSRHARIRSNNYDLFINVVGGLRLFDTSADLPLALAIASTILGKRIPARAVALGEIGLGGEIRHVPRLQQRLQAAFQLGFRTAIIPASADAKLDHMNMRILKARNIAEAVTLAFGADFVAARTSKHAHRGRFKEQPLTASTARLAQSDAELEYPGAHSHSFTRFDDAAIEGIDGAIADFASMGFYNPASK